MDCIKNLSTRRKMAFIIYLLNVERAILRGHKKIMKRGKDVSLVPKQCEPLGSTAKSFETVIPSINKCLSRIRYAIIRTFYIETVKQLAIFLALNKRIIPVHLNCYILGRFSIHSSLIECAPVLGAAFGMLGSVWHYMMDHTKYTLELETVDFLLYEEHQVQKEIDDIKTLNGKYNVTLSERNFPTNILQHALVYRVDYGNMQIYRLRPNRVIGVHRKLVDLTSLLLTWFVAFYVTFGTPVFLSSFAVMLFDVNYIRNYPTCCSLSEALLNQGHLPEYSISYKHCSMKSITFIFDLSDIFIFYLAIGPPIFLGGVLIIIISEDLLYYWRHISGLVREISDCNKQRSSNTGLDISSRGQYEMSPALFDGGVTKRRDGPCSCRLIELQALICDFFERIGKANKLADPVVSFTMGVFVGTHLVYGYLAAVRPNLWTIVAVKLNLICFYIVLFTQSLLVLRLKRAIDSTYSQLCSLMAYDPLEQKVKWIPILDNYIFKKRNGFTVLNSLPYTRYLVLNLATSAISFLIAVETYKNPHANHS